ncbi:Neurofilament heavy polypeptide [Frankliniella fusca]|uniref:Neurofilament heavy polypeptide n=1 Tax=Frankliniella fusca TaxID=407009 RepID=A0AAE1GU98_9NEOP|nr:Neurofilament heavy polypeptide [Frankliniella fusca]
MESSGPGPGVKSVPAGAGTTATLSRRLYLSLETVKAQMKASAGSRLNELTRLTAPQVPWQCVAQMKNPVVCRRATEAISKALGDAVQSTADLAAAAVEQAVGDAAKAILAPGTSDLVHQVVEQTATLSCPEALELISKMTGSAGRSSGPLQDKVETALETVLLESYQKAVSAISHYVLQQAVEMVLQTSVMPSLLSKVMDSFGNQLLDVIQSDVVRPALHPTTRERTRNVARAAAAETVNKCLTQAMSRNGPVRVLCVGPSAAAAAAAAQPGGAGGVRKLEKGVFSAASARVPPTCRQSLSFKPPPPTTATRDLTEEMTVQEGIPPGLLTPDTTPDDVDGQATATVFIPNEDSSAWKTFSVTMPAATGPSGVPVTVVPVACDPPPLALKNASPAPSPAKAVRPPFPGITPISWMKGKAVAKRLKMDPQAQAVTSAAPASAPATVQAPATASASTPALASAPASTQAPATASVLTPASASDLASTQAPASAQAPATASALTPAPASDGASAQAPATASILTPASASDLASTQAPASAQAPATASALTPAPASDGASAQAPATASASTPASASAPAESSAPASAQAPAPASASAPASAQASALASTPTSSPDPDALAPSTAPAAAQVPAFSTTIASLPDEILVRVLQHVEPLVRLTLCRLVCRRWRDLCSGEAMWRREQLRYEARNKSKFSRVLRLAPQLAFVDCERLSRKGPRRAPSDVPRHVTRALLETPCRVRGLRLATLDLDPEYVISVLERHAPTLEELHLIVDADLVDLSAPHTPCLVLHTIDHMPALRRLSLTGDFPIEYNFGPRPLGAPPRALEHLDLSGYTSCSPHTACSLLQAHHATLCRVVLQRAGVEELIDASLCSNLVDLTVPCRVLAQYAPASLHTVCRLTLTGSAHVLDLLSPAGAAAVRRDLHRSFMLPSLEELVLDGVTTPGDIPKMVHSTFQDIRELTFRATKMGGNDMIGLLQEMPALEAVAFEREPQLSEGVLITLPHLGLNMKRIRIYKSLVCSPGVCWKPTFKFLSHFFPKADIQMDHVCGCDAKV